jgi:hypothetical protein
VKKQILASLVTWRAVRASCLPKVGPRAAAMLSAWLMSACIVLVGALIGTAARAADPGPTVGGPTTRNAVPSPAQGGGRDLRNPLDPGATSDGRSPGDRRFGDPRSRRDAQPGRDQRSMPAPAASPLELALHLPNSQQYSTSYKILLQRSIFARDHRSSWIAPGSRGPGDAGGPNGANGIRRAPAPPDPEELLALRGVGIEDGLATAFVEDTGSRRTQSLHVGDTIAKGRVAGIQLLDGIDYRSGAKLLHVHIGETLKGTVAASAAPATEPSSSSGGSSKTSRWVHSHDDSAPPASGAAPSPGAQGGPSSAPSGDSRGQGFR